MIEKISLRVEFKNVTADDLREYQNKIEEELDNQDFIDYSGDPVHPSGAYHEVGDLEVTDVPGENAVIIVPIVNAGGAAGKVLASSDVLDKFEEKIKEIVDAEFDCSYYGS